MNEQSNTDLGWPVVSWVPVVVVTTPKKIFPYFKNFKISPLVSHTNCSCAFFISEMTQTQKTKCKRTRLPEKSFDKESPPKAERGALVAIH